MPARARITLCLTLRISSGYRSLIYPCITTNIAGHRRLTRSTHQICRPTYNGSQSKQPSAILNLQYLDTLSHGPSLKPKSAAAHQISLKSDDPRLRYSDETIFKMAAVRHLDFSEIANLITWPVAEQIVLLRTKFHVNRTTSR